MPTSVRTQESLSLMQTPLPPGLVLAYASRRDEPDLRPWLEQLVSMQRLVLPRCEGDNLVLHHIESLEHDLVTGAFSLQEPKATCATVDPASLSLVLVPGLAFDVSGGRLGRGRGYYDRLLERTTCPLWGTALTAHIVDKVPLEPHDRRLTHLLTPRGCFPCRAP